MTLIDRNPKSARAQFERLVLAFVGVLVVAAVFFTARLAFGQTEAPPPVVPPGAPWWAQLVLAAMGLVSLVVGGVLVPAWKKKIDADTAAKKAEGESTFFQRVLAGLNEILRAVVADVDANLKPLVAKALADGVVSPAEGKELREAALARAKAVLGAAGLAQLKAVFGIETPEALDSFILGKIEHLVSVKNLALAAATPAAQPSSP